MTKMPLTKTALVSLAASLGLGACSTVSDIPTSRIGGGTLYLANGVPAGTLQLVSNGDTVSLVVAATGLSAGTRGFHLHTKGECTGPDFTSAGGHLNPLNRTHGKDSTGGAHLGDMPNLVFGTNQSATQTVTLSGSRSEIEQWLFDSDGTAVMIHAQADDYRTDPTGNAGARVACAVLMRG